MGIFNKPNREPETVTEAYQAKITELEENLAKAVGRALDMEERAKRAELTAQIADDETRHLVKMKLEESEINIQRRIMEIESQKQREVHQIQLDYQEKLESELRAQLDRMKEMYGEVLARLPNIKLNGDVSPK